MCPCMNMKREISEVGNTTIWSGQRCHGWSPNDGTASCLIHPSPIHPSELGRRHLLSRIIQPITVGVAGVSHQPFWLIHFKKFCIPVIFELPSGELNGPHTQTIRHFFHKELRKPTEIETCFFLHHLGAFSISRVETMVFVASLISSLLQKNESMICFFSHRKCLAALWKSLRNRWRRHLPENHRVFFMHVKLPTMRYFQGLEVRLGWVPSSDVLRVWMAGWDFQHVFFASKRRDDFQRET